jgi:hypothetical protein
MVDNNDNDNIRWDHLYCNIEKVFDIPILLKASIVHGFKRGSKELGFPTANLNMEELGKQGEELNTGIYFGWILLNNIVYETVVSVGYNPVYKNETKTIEAYIINQILPDFYGEPIRAKNIPPPTAGNIKRYPGKVIYGKDLTFKGGSHGSALEIIPVDKAKDMASSLPVVPESPSNHFANFLKACKGEEKCRSSFDIAGPLSQVMALGVLAQRLNTKLIFNSRTNKITNSKVGNELLYGPPPRKGWEQYYKM